MRAAKPSADNFTVKMRLCLDFSNTLEWHASDDPHESITSYSDLVNWARSVGIVTDREARQLLRNAARHPDEASAVLERAILIRESIYRGFSAIAAGRPPKRADLDTLNSALAEAMSRSHIIQTTKGFVWGWEASAEALDRMLWSVIRSAAELLTSDQLERVRECAGQGCGWLFLDVSRTQLRRWCDMKSCGNRAKARRHYERIKAGR